jgi:hypothetical protein
MTEKQEAVNLVGKFQDLVLVNNYDEPDFNRQKQCAVIVIEKILELLPTIDYDKQSEDYEFLYDWYCGVRREIESM